MSIKTLYDNAPAFYAARNIPKVRWMYPGKAYKARYMQVSYKYDEARLFILVLDDTHVIAYRDEQFTREIGMLRLEHFQLIQHIDLEELPPYSSRSPIEMDYDRLLSIEEDIVHCLEVPASVPAPVGESQEASEECEPIHQVVESIAGGQLAFELF